MKKILSGILITVFVSMLIINCGGEEKKVTKKATSMLDKTKNTEMIVDLANGKKTYEKICIACHLTGVAGAAAVTDKVRWQANADKGMPVLHQSVINGVPNGKYGVMPARGSCTDCSEKDLYDGIGYMIDLSGVRVKKNRII